MKLANKFPTHITHNEGFRYVFFALNNLVIITRHNGEHRMKKWNEERRNGY